METYQSFAILTIAANILALITCKEKAGWISSIMGWTFALILTFEV